MDVYRLNSCNHFVYTLVGCFQHEWDNPLSPKNQDAFKLLYSCLYTWTFQFGCLTWFRYGGCQITIPYGFTWHTLGNFSNSTLGRPHGFHPTKKIQSALGSMEIHSTHEIICLDSWQPKWSQLISLGVFATKKNKGTVIYTNIYIDVATTGLSFKHIKHGTDTFAKCVVQTLPGLEA